MLVALGGATGCESLAVPTFTGTNLTLQLKGSGPTQPGQHLEMWGRNDNNDILRIGFRVAPTQPEILGFMIRPAVTLTDPCMIADNGYLLTDARAYPNTITENGVKQTPSQQAGQITTLIRQVISMSAGGIQTSNLLLTMPYDATPVPSIPADAAPADRIAACKAYWDAGPYTYTPAPLTLTAPAHGMTMGPVDYSTSVPLNSYSGIPFVTLYDLSNLEEFWITVETVPPDKVDPQHRGAVYLEGKRVMRGDGTLNFDLSSSDPAVSGSLLLIMSQSGY